MNNRKEVKEQLFRLNKTSRKSVALYHRIALSIGISDSALGVLYALPEMKSPCSQYDLCGEWSLPKQTVNSAVSDLRKKGLVSLSPVSGSRNKKSILLTDAGKDLAGKTIVRLRDAELDTLAEFTPEERELYVSLNERYNQSLAGKLDRILPEEGPAHGNSERN